MKVWDSGHRMLTLVVSFCCKKNDKEGDVDIKTFLILRRS